jgi:hypothetical protein
VVFSDVLDASAGAERVIEGSSWIGAGDVAGDSDVFETPLKIPRDRDSLRASRDPSLSSIAVKPRVRKSSF